ncbi:branched-chain amino acid ABC transporter permease [Halovenus sp. HT40]|uniref:branched-chain amino acid ABC transporter permease n=1 Tax=Halovenus sp. HT40 TaxID=3126691 RepID=UPI00300E9AC3
MFSTGTFLKLSTVLLQGGVIDGFQRLLQPDTFVVQTINGLRLGFILFLIAAGLTVILGILDVLNLAHGELYALGAYIAASVGGFLVGEGAGAIMAPPTSFDPVTSFAFVGVLVLVALITALILVPIGVIIETVFVRPIYERDQVYQLVLTFALLLIIANLIEFIWGPNPQSLDLSTKTAVNDIPSFSLLGISGVPTLVALVMVVSLAVGVLLFWFFSKTKTGRIIRATAIDREMATALGVSPDRTFTLVFALGAFLAGFGGAMELVRTSAQAGMGEDALVLSFVVIVVGGLGSLRGAVVGSLIIGVLQNWMVVVEPSLETAAPFVVMVLVLLVKPEGLFGTWGERT